MKSSKIFLLATVSFSAVAFTACTGKKSAETKSATAQDSVYACPMHPEVKGKKGDKCSKCGMALTEVKAK